MLGRILMTGMLGFLTFIPDLATAQVNAWGTIKFVGAGTAQGNWAQRFAANYSVRLTSRDGRFNRSVKLGRIGSKFEFKNVPTETPMTFKITYKSSVGEIKQVYQASYTFHKSSLLGGIRGRKAAGYIGDFNLDFKSGKITRLSNRY